MSLLPDKCNLEYKTITAETIDEISEMFAETFNASPWNDKWTLETARKRLNRMMNCQDFFGLCAYESGALCGAILGNNEYYYDGVMFHIQEFFIKNSFRGQGIGTKILKEFEERLKRQGIKSIMLLTSKGIETEGFYKKQGFATCGGMIMMSKHIG